MDVERSQHTPFDPSHASFKLGQRSKARGHAPKGPRWAWVSWLAFQVVDVVVCVRRSARCRLPGIRGYGTGTWWSCGVICFLDDLAAKCFAATFAVLFERHINQLEVRAVVNNFREVCLFNFS